MYNYDHEDPTFVEDLERSKVAVRKTATYLSEKGFPILLEPTFVRPTSVEKAAFSDTGDLKVQLTIEVKHRPKLYFSSAEDFKYPTVIIDACHCFDKHDIKPIWYFIWSADYQSCIVIDVFRTQKYWFKTQKYDHQKNRNRSFYEVDISHCRFIQLSAK